MASLKFRHYATESALKGNSTVQNALNAFDVGTIVFIDDTQKQYIITSKSNNVVTYKIYYGEAAVVGVSRTDATLTLTFSDGSEIAVKINNVEHATSSDTADTAKSVDWNNVSGKPTNFVTTDDTQTITGAKTFTNNVSLQGSTSADSITTEDLIVNGAARFVSGLTGDLKGNVVGNVTGNVTGNVSGSSGSCTGNALTATTLQTARSINGTSFNGSQAITTAKWGTARNITIADNTNEHTQANNSIDGSADFTLKLPTTIKADIIGNASTADSAKSVAWANVTGKPNPVTTDTEQTITGAKIFNNNTTFKNETDVESLTADSLLVTGSARFTNTINGNLKGDVEGNLTGNATTATTAAICTGNSATATALTTNAGSTNIPVYFTEGKPSAISIIAGTMDIERPLVVVTDNNELYKTSGITANYSKNSITATTFKGNLEGNALTATTALSCSGNSATATLANEAKNLQNTTPETKDESFFSKVVTEDADMVSFQTLKGNSVVWNQRVKVKETFTANGVHFEKNGNSIKVYTDTDGATNTTLISDMLGGKQWSRVAIVGHKYSMSGCPNGGSLESFHMSCYSSNSWQGEKFDTGDGVVFSVTENVPNGYPRMVVAKGTIITTPIYFRPQLIDLTQMFGAGNEPTTYEEFLSRKPKVADEYAYNEGTIVNNKVEKVVTTGRNLWDEEWEVGSLDGSTGQPVEAANIFRSKNYCPILGGAEYYLTSASFIINLFYYDKDKNFLAGKVFYGNNVAFTTPEDAAYFKVRTDSPNNIYNHDVCINISDSTINGQYFPYEKHELDFSWVKEIKNGEGVKLFEDGIKSAGATFDEVAKGRAIKRLGVKVFDGTEEWNYASGSTPYFYYVGISAAGEDKSEIRPVVCNYYPFGKGNWYNNTLNTVCISHGNTIIITDTTYTTISAWKAHLADLYAQGNPLVVYYELSEPVEVELQYGINHTLPVWKDGMMCAESSQSSTPIVCTNAYYTNIRESVKKFIGDADSIYASTSGYNAHGTWNIDISGKASSAITANSAITATSATTATTCTGNAATATALQNTRKINGTDFNGSADITTSKWGTARNITISDGTNSGTATNVDGSSAITLNLPGTIKANLSGNAATATKATNADRATGDSDGNAINTTYLKRSGGTVTGNVIFNSSVTADSITAEDLIVNGAGRFVSGITGDLVGNVTGNVTGNLSGNASSATNATNDGSGNTITSTYATKTERSNNDITAASLTASKLTLTRAAGNITANIPTWNQDTTGTAAKATADANGNNIANTYATKAEVAALPKSMVIKGTLDASHALPTSGMTEGDTYIVGASGTYNGIACKVGDFFVRTSDGWLRVPAGDEWEYNENTIKGIKVNNAGHADTAGTAVSAGSATSDSNGNNIASTYARINKVYDDSGDYRQFLGKNGDSSNWIRTTTTGILPYTSGNSSNGHSSLGTSSWYFSKAYIQNIYGYLNGNISGSSTSCSGNAATATNADKLGNLNADNYFKQRDAVFNSDWSGKYLWTLWDNHLYAADKRFAVTLTGTDVTNLSYLFDGSFESSVSITETKAVLHIKHTTAGNVWTSGLPYGSFYVVFYNSDAENVTGRVYCNYDGQGIGWHDLTATHVRPHVWELNNGYYQLSDLEITITKPASSASIQLCQVLHEVTRSSGPNLAAVMSKYCNQKTDYNIEAAKFIGPLQGNAATATTASSCSGNSATATKAGYLDTGGMTLYAHNNNEINFGGTNGSDTIYVGYRATENRPIPTKFIFGGSGTATLTAGGFKKSGSSSSYVLTGDGGHTAISELSVNYAASSGACTGNAATATKATQDSDGNAINTTYLKRSGGTVTGNVTFNSSVTSDSLTTEDLIVNGAARFVSGLTGDLVGNVTGNLTGTASYATNAGACTGNAATATKLETARTIWGQSFDGSGNITGPIHVKYKSSEWGNWNEGIRLYGSAASGVWSNIHFGCDPNATSGSHTNQWMMGRNGGNHFGIWHGTDSTNAVFFINTSNNVGIGTTSPTSKLHVAGTGYFASDVSSAANIIAGGYIKGETVKISSGCTLEYSSTDKCIRFVFN